MQHRVITFVHLSLYYPGKALSNKDIVATVGRTWLSLTQGRKLGMNKGKPILSSRSNQTVDDDDEGFISILYFPSIFVVVNPRW